MNHYQDIFSKFFLITSALFLSFLFLGIIFIIIPFFILPKFDITSVEIMFKQIFWAGMIVNAYLPSTVFPTGLDAEGLPIGLQAVSAPYRDHRTIEFAKQITQHVGGFKAPENMIA